MSHSPEYESLHKIDPAFCSIIDCFIERPGDLEYAAKQTMAPIDTLEKLLMNPEFRSIYQSEARHRKNERERGEGAKWLSDEARDVYREAKTDGRILDKLESLKLIGKIEGTLEDSIVVKHGIDVDSIRKMTLEQAEQRKIELRERLIRAGKLDAGSGTLVDAGIRPADVQD